MPNSQIKSLTVDGVTYDIVDKTSGYIATETDPTVPSWAKQNTKPSYTAGEVGAVATNAVGAASGVAPLNASSKIDSTYLPSYVDDVIEGYYYNNKFWEEGSHTTEIPGEAGKIYVDLSTDKTYRYSGSAFVEISKGGSVVTVSRDLTSGSKVGIVNVDGTSYQLYAPTPPTKTSDLTNDSGFVTANEAATAAPVQSVNGQTGAVTVVEDDKTWNSVRLVQTATTPGTCYIPTLGDYNSSTAYVTYATYNPDNLKIVLYDNNSYIHSTTPSANDNSNKVATTAYVDAAIPTLPDVSRFIPTTTNSGAIGARDGFSLYQYSNTSTGGFRRLTLGNDKSYLTSDGAYGVIRFYDGTQYYHGDLLPDLNLYGDQTWTLPAKTGTIALTSDIPDISTLITNPSTKTTDQYLQYNGTNWIASDLPVYDGTVTPSVTPARTAVVKITWNNSTVTTRGFSIVYGREMSTSGNTWYSIELPLDYNQFWFGDKYYTTYMPVPIPASNNDFKAIILFDYYSYVNYTRSTSGNISTTSVNCKYKISDSEWNSATYYGYVITGDGTITITAS